MLVIGFALIFVLIFAGAIIVTDFYYGIKQFRWRITMFSYFIRSNTANKFLVVVFILLIIVGIIKFLIK